MAWVAEPFFASLAGSGFIAVRAPDGSVEIIDGNNTMPHSPPDEPGQGITRVFLEYSNGMYTGVGGGSVAVPGILAAVRTAWERHGRIEWAALFEDAIKVAREGFPFPKTSAYYLSVTWEAIWSQFEEAATVFTDDEGDPLTEGKPMIQNDLADALEEVAHEGQEAFYGGSIGESVVRAITSEGGWLNLDDLRSYSAEVRRPLSTDAFGWKIETNPPPAVGGAVLAHMLALLDDVDLRVPVDRAIALVEAQRAAIGYRVEHYQDPDAIAAAFEEAIASLGGASPETTHSSAADSNGYACSITESNGYGSGLVVRGVLLNNTLGEEELNPMGIHGLPAGTRCHSNMAPTIASGGGKTVAIGSPGADRIVMAIAQTLVRIAVDGNGLQEAVAAPRVHLENRVEGPLLCYEPGIPGELLGYNPRPYDSLHMYFGGVQVASVDDDGRVDAAFDPRRSGGRALI